ncbi:hypothetical protein GCM10011611_11040 [Aliidongia dinghuensis]|uniref:DUF3471 domain-containing protein n=1 Tax=Aliidongia dinghuensis TaxID=1867774 RepID=A0A8J2YR14_9PROT|nr:hypothetical protein [Aliidongia dinghuensis]GGF07387.1 hypothetical protein GCM10011611_11040 [Aliidongia dinghuensis]
MVRHLLLPAAAVALVLASPSLAGSGLTPVSYSAPVYVPGTEDVPLMPGLAADDAASLVFDKPQGRIVEAAAHGAVTRHAVVAFYDESLPQLGWRRAAAPSTTTKSFERDGERLSLDFDGRDGNLQVAFTLAPR